MDRDYIREKVQYLQHRREYLLKSVKSQTEELLSVEEEIQQWKEKYVEEKINELDKRLDVLCSSDSSVPDTDSK